MKFYLALAVVLVWALASCKKDHFSNIPQISALSIYPDSVKAGSSSDTVYLKFHLRDGDADIGNDQSTTNYDVYLIDNRTNDTSGYFFPQIDPAILNTDNGAEGDCIIKLLAAFIIPRPDHTQGDTVHYTVYMKDRAQNASNFLTTPDIYIKP